MNRVDQAGSALTGAWSAAQASIRGAEGQLGAGPLGQAFMGRYRPQAGDLVARADASTPVLGRLAQAGQQGPEDYQETDAAAAAAMPRDSAAP